MDRPLVNKEQVSLIRDLVVHHAQQKGVREIAIFNQTHGISGIQEETTNEHHNNVWIVRTSGNPGHTRQELIHWVEWIYFHCIKLLDFPRKEEFIQNTIFGHKHPVNKMHQLIFPNRYLTTSQETTTANA